MEQYGGATVLAGTSSCWPTRSRYLDSGCLRGDTRGLNTSTSARHYLPLGFPDQIYVPEYNGCRGPSCITFNGLTSPAHADLLQRQLPLNDPARGVPMVR